MFPESRRRGFGPLRPKPCFSVECQEWSKDFNQLSFGKVDVREDFLRCLSTCLPIKPPLFSEVFGFPVTNHKHCRGFFSTFCQYQ